MSFSGMNIIFRGHELSLEHCLELYEKGFWHNLTDNEEAGLSFLFQWTKGVKQFDVKTSGSTGNPKTIFFKKEQLIQSALQTQKYLGYTNGATALLCLPARFIAGKMMLVRALVSHFHLIFTEPVTSPLATVQKKVDFCAMTPMQVEQSLKEGLSDFLPQHLIIGGAPVSKNLESLLSGRKEKIVESYGMTETITHIAFRALSPKTATHFVPFEGIRLRQDERGCLCIKAPYLDEEISTNDLVAITHGVEFQILGRTDNIINSGGVKIIPEELEKKIARFIQQPFMLCGIPDDTLGEALILLVEKQINKPESKEDLLQNVKQIQGCKYVKKLYFVDNFVYTETGKINRKKSRQLFLERLKNIEDGKH